MLKGLPRHIGLHTGGFVLASDPLDEQCILEPARMENRSVVPWDKDDVDALGWMKVDLLSLGMLTAIRKCFHMIGDRNRLGRPLNLYSIPLEDTAVYDALCRADTVGVFQIESRAQMNMLPRLRPRTFYDIVIEVAIVRPGPLQGGMVHPYIKRRQGLVKDWTYEHPDLEPILKKTHGVPIFQEQVMKMAVAVAGFTPGESDLMRKMMSGAWRQKMKMGTLKEKLFHGMRAKGLKQEYIDRLYKQMEGFGEYGFPESHAASFAKITYVSSWLKLYHPAEFLCALLNSQPMGFYAPRALVGDAERHGVVVHPPDVFHSAWDSTLEPQPSGPPHVRLGLRLIDGLSQDEAKRVVELQTKGLLAPSRSASPPTLAELRAADLPQRTLEKLVRAGACRSLATTDADPRSAQGWELLGLRRTDPARPRLALENKGRPAREFLPRIGEWESLLRDYETTGLSAGRHPTPYAREKLFPDPRWVTAEGVYLLPMGSETHVIGLLSVKQKPPTAGGMCFLTLEDETGFFNLALGPEEYEKYRLVIQTGCLIAARARVERSAPVDPQDPRTAAVSLRVRELWCPGLGQKKVGRLDSKPRDFR
jgi:DNA polymerase-3 subunit alpha/error-prone DNA polymerase